MLAVNLFSLRYEISSFRHVQTILKLRLTVASKSSSENVSKGPMPCDDAAELQKP